MYICIYIHRYVCYIIFYISIYVNCEERKKILFLTFLKISIASILFGTKDAKLGGVYKM